MTFILGGSKQVPYGMTKEWQLQRRKLAGVEELAVDVRPELLEDEGAAVDERAGEPALTHLSPGTLGRWVVG